MRWSMRGSLGRAELQQLSGLCVSPRLHGDYLGDSSIPRQKSFLLRAGLLYSECPCDETTRYVGEEGSTNHNHG